MQRKDTTTDMMRSYVADALLCLLKKRAYAQVAIKELAAGLVDELNSRRQAGSSS